MAFKVEYSLVDVPDSLRGKNAQKIIQEEYSVAIARILEDLNGKFRKGSPSALGILRNSWVIDPPKVRGRFIGGNVSSSVTQALVVDRGARTHFPPVGDEPALAPWIRRKLGITDPTEIRQKAFLIGRKFKRSGIKKRSIFTNIFKQQRGLRTRELEAAKNRVIERLGQ